MFRTAQYTISFETVDLAREELFIAMVTLGYGDAHLARLLAAFDELSTALGYDYEPKQITAARALTTEQ